MWKVMSGVVRRAGNIASLSRALTSVTNGAHPSLSIQQRSSELPVWRLVDQERPSPMDSIGQGFLYAELQRRTFNSSTSIASPGDGHAAASAANAERQLSEGKGQGVAEVEAERSGVADELAESALESLRKEAFALAEGAIRISTDSHDMQDHHVFRKLQLAQEKLQVVLMLSPGDADAMFALASLNLDVVDRRLRPKMGRALLLEAAEKGHPSAQYRLGCDLREAGNEEDALSLFQKAADQGHPKALFVLGAALLASSDSEVAQSAASKYFRAAAQQGHAVAAISHAAIIAREGAVEGALDEVEREELKDSRDLLGQAADSGFDLAAMWLDTITTKNPAVPSKDP